MSTSKKFVVKNGLDNNGNSISNIGVGGASLTQVGANSLTLTTTGTTNVTFPVSGTLATLTDTVAAASNIASGVANQIPVQSGTSTTTFISAPSVASTFLSWTGSAFAWSTAAAGGGVLYENSTTLSSNYSITSGKNAMMVGPLTVANGVTLTIPTGSRLVVL